MFDGVACLFLVRQQLSRPGGTVGCMEHRCGNWHRCSRVGGAHLPVLAAAVSGDRQYPLRAWDVDPAACSPQPEFTQTLLLDTFTSDQQGFAY